MKKINFVIALLVVSIILAACGSAPAATPTLATAAQPLPAVVSASGKVLPSRWANLSFETGGLLVELKAQLGDQLKTGDLIARIDDTDARLAVAQAGAALVTAQAQLAQLKVGARPEEIAQAEQTVKAAAAAWQGAQAQYAQLRSGAQAADIAAAEAALAQAAVERKVAQDSYDLASKCYNFKRPDGTKDSICPSLGTAEEQARAALAAAEEAYHAAQQRVDQLKTGATKNELAASGASVAATLAQMNAAQAQLDLLQAGASPEQLAVAQANVKQAQAALDAAQAQLNKLQIAAPFDGTIGLVSARQGELTSPGQSIVMLGDLGTLRVETTDLSETDIARVQVGQPVKVTFDALPGKTLTGKVTSIAPMSTPGQSAVNYTVTIELDQIDPALRWGMTAFADVQIGQ